MKLVKQTLIAAAVGASLFGGAAHAGAIGTAYLSIEDLLATRTDNGAILTVGTDLVPVGEGIINVGDTRATLDGVTQDETLQAPPVAINDVSGAGFSCVGACAYANNTFSYLTKPADTASSYVVSDVVLTGALVAGIPDPDNPGGFIPPGANAETLAESAVVPNSIGSAESNVGVNSSFSFISNIDTDLTFSGAFDAYLRAALINVDGVTANASIGWQVTLEDLTDDDIFEYNLSEDDEWVRGNISSTIAGQDRDSTFAGAFSASTTGTFLTSGHAYQLTISHTSGADSQATATPMAIPAPLALMGAGLLLLGGLQRKRNRSAAA